MLKIITFTWTHTRRKLIGKLPKIKEWLNNKYKTIPIKHISIPHCCEGSFWISGKASIPCAHRRQRDWRTCFPPHSRMSQTGRLDLGEHRSGFWTTWAFLSQRSIPRWFVSSLGHSWTSTRSRWRSCRSQWRRPTRKTPTVLPQP